MANDWNVRAKALEDGGIDKATVCGAGHVRVRPMGVCGARQTGGNTALGNTAAGAVPLLALGVSVPLAGRL